MLKAIREFINLACISCLLLLPVSCSDNGSGVDEPGIPARHDDITLSIGFKMPVRASEGYEDGDNDENFLDIANGNYRIYFFDRENKFIARFGPAGFLSADGVDYRQYSVTGKAPDALALYSEFKIVVLANWPEYPEDDANTPLTAGVTTIADICNADWAQYDCLTDNDKTNPVSVALDPLKGKLMPFYGVHEYSGVTFVKNQVNRLEEPVTLLRAMAKVEVILETDDNFNLSFSDLRINRYNAKGYCAPESAFTHGDYDHGGNWAGDYLRDLHLVNGSNDVTGKDLSLRLARRWSEQGTAYEQWEAYIPEYRNIGSGDAFSSIKARFNIQSEDDNPHTIYFAGYTDGQTDNSDASRLNIERNNIYRFNVKVSPLLLLVSVEKWDFGGKVHIDM